jgi:hypothetical protein
MRPLLIRLLLAATLSALLGGLIVPAVAGWAEQPPVCDNGTGVCVSIDDNYVAPRAVNCCTDTTWVGNVYPNTSTTINDTVSSLRNGFTSLDILFFKEPGLLGDVMCVTSGKIINDLGFGLGSWDDVISSNSVVSGTACN